MSQSSMSRDNITAKDVFQASEALVAAGQTPTQGRIRDYLGRGSRGTIHKYLKQWKENCFKKSFSLQNNPTIEDKTVLEEKCILEKALEKQMSEHALLSEQLLEAERRLMHAKEKNQQLSVHSEELKSRYAILEASHATLQEAYQVLRDSQENTLQTFLKDKNHHIESLRQELKELNEASLMTVKDMGYQGDEALMTEKVKTVHLNDQVKALEKTVIDLKKQLLKEQFVKDRENKFAIKRVSDEEKKET